jgi:hypothetical protein
MDWEQCEHWRGAILQALSSAQNGQAVELCRLVAGIPWSSRFGWCSMRKLRYVISCDGGVLFIVFWIRAGLSGGRLEMIMRSRSSPALIPREVLGASLLSTVYGGHGVEVRGMGQVWCSLISNSRGTFIGKATTDECWFGIHGCEMYQTSNFKRELARVVLPENRGRFILKQEGYGELWFAMALTPYGSIPGKASDGGICWYTYGGREYMTESFMYLAVRIKPFSETVNPYWLMSRTDIVSALIGYQIFPSIESLLGHRDLACLSLASKQMDFLREALYFHKMEYESCCMDICCTLELLLYHPLRWPGLVLENSADVDFARLGEGLGYCRRVEAIWGLSTFEIRKVDYVLEYYGTYYRSFIDVLASPLHPNNTLMPALDMLRESVFHTSFYLPVGQGLHQSNSGLVLLFQWRGIVGSLFVAGQLDPRIFHAGGFIIDLDSSASECSIENPDVD